MFTKPLGLALSWELMTQKKLGPCLGLTEGSRVCARHSYWPALQQWPGLCMSVGGGTNSGGPRGPPRGNMSWMLGGYRD